MKYKEETQIARNLLLLSVTAMAIFALLYPLYALSPAPRDRWVGLKAGYPDRGDLHILKQDSAPRYAAEKREALSGSQPNGCDTDEAVPKGRKVDRFALAVPLPMPAALTSRSGGRRFVSRISDRLPAQTTR